MRQVTFEKSLKYADKDIMIQSDFLRKLVKNAPKTYEFNMVKLIADEVPMSMDKINEFIRKCYDDITYIEIMSNSKFFVIEY